MFPINLLVFSIRTYPKARNAITWLAAQTAGSPLRREHGQGLVEYGLILALVAIVVIIVLALLGPAIGQVFGRVYCSIVLGIEYDMTQSYMLENGTCTVISEP